MASAAAPTPGSRPGAHQASRARAENDDIEGIHAAPVLLQVSNKSGCAIKHQVSDPAGLQPEAGDITFRPAQKPESPQVRIFEGVVKHGRQVLRLLILDLYQQVIF